VLGGIGAGYVVQHVTARRVLGRQAGPGQLGQNGACLSGRDTREACRGRQADVGTAVPPSSANILDAGTESWRKYDLLAYLGVPGYASPPSRAG
jgi:hypothetical protein